MRYARAMKEKNKHDTYCCNYQPFLWVGGGVGGGGGGGARNWPAILNPFRCASNVVGYKLLFQVINMYMYH